VCMCPAVRRNWLRVSICFRVYFAGAR
jgi:hypothetical protein